MQTQAPKAPNKKNASRFWREGFYGEMELKIHKETAFALNCKTQFFITMEDSNT